MRVLRLTIALCASLLPVAVAQEDPARSLDYAMALHLDASPIDCRVFAGTVPENAGACYSLAGSLGEILADLDAAILSTDFGKVQDWRHTGLPRVFDVWEVVLRRDPDVLSIKLFHNRSVNLHIVSVAVLETDHPTSMAYLRLDQELSILVGAVMQPCSAQVSLALDAEPERCYFGLKSDALTTLLQAVDAGLLTTGFAPNGTWQLETDVEDQELWMRFFTISDAEVVALLLTFSRSSGEVGGLLQLFAFD